MRAFLLLAAGAYLLVLVATGFAFLFGDPTVADRAADLGGTMVGLGALLAVVIWLEME